MSQPSAADRAAQAPELDTQVTKAIGITFENFAYVSTINGSRCGPGIFRVSELRDPAYVCTATVQAGDVQRDFGQRVDANGVGGCVVRVLTRRLALV